MCRREWAWTLPERRRSDRSTPGPGNTFARNAGSADASIVPSHVWDWHDDRALDAEEVGDGSAARRHLDWLIAAKPDDGLRHARRALAMLIEGGDQPVEADLEQAIRLGPRDRMVDWIAHRADDLRAAGKLAGSLRLLDFAVAARSDDWRLRSLRAETLGALGRHAEREADLLRAIDMGADTPVMLRFADEWRLSGRPHEASLLYKRMLATRTVPFEVWERAALALLAAGNDTEYRRLCATMRSKLAGCLSETNVTWQVARVCTLGRGGLGDDSELVRLLETTLPSAATKHSERKQFVLGLLGAVHYRSGRFSKAIDLIQQSVADADGHVGPENAAFLAMAFQYSGNRRQALQMLAMLRDHASRRANENFWGL